MITPLVLCAALAAAPASEEPATAEAHLYVRPAEVEVGQPFEVVLTVFHPADAASVPDAPEVEVDPSWVLLASRREPSEPDPSQPGLSVTRRVVRLASLEPGSRAVPAVFAEALRAAGAEVVGRAPLIEVRGVLAEGEDEPRSLAGFPEGFVPAREGGRGGLAWLAGGAALVVTALVGLLLLRRRRAQRRAAGEPPAAPLERLEALRARAAEAPEAAHFELSHLVRESTDRRLERSRAGLTDEEWLRALEREAALDATTREELETVLARCAAAKYSGERPTSWALDQTLADARRVLALVTREAGAA